MAPSRAGLLLLVALAASGCSRTAPPPHLARLQVVEGSLSGVAEMGLDAAAVEALARAALAEAGFRFGAGEPAYLARVELTGLRVGPSAGGRGLRVDVRIELELEASGGGEASRREGGAGGEAVAAGGPAAAVRAALAAALGEAARGARLGLSAEQKPAEALLADLESPDVRVRDHAVQALGERREPSAVPGLVRRLQDSDRRVVDRAIGALTQLKDPRSVAPLIELSRQGDPAEALRLIPVVGDIGGPDAEGWLLTLQQAHPDHRVRAAAAAALATLPVPPAPPPTPARPAGAPAR
ncbi:MAG: HEAT repeat domain-containing protein [Anaeromyxobacter sp.]|nr:HEAT repeat domain-containing protein [Anaeromyxobacter sp.]MBL0277883.1 HEAT repeat domain-containing protein [Anaeromyxobacter sp.]